MSNKLEKQNGEQFGLICPIPIQSSEFVRLGHGSGGRLSSELIKDVFLPMLGNNILNTLDDASLVEVNNMQLAITVDSYVVNPIFFPGGDIGSLSVFGTVNDLSMRGAIPVCIAGTFIMEEGLPMADLHKIVESMKQACLQAKVQFVAGDTKVVNRGAADKIFITTCGLGKIEEKNPPAGNRATIGDKIIVSGDIGRHGTAVMCAREAFELETTIESDSAPLNHLVQQMLSACGSIHCLRDITRGGLASVLNELAGASNVCIEIEENAVPIAEQVLGVCALLGLDPLYVACEGRLVAIVSASDADLLLDTMRQHPLGKDSQLIGQVSQQFPERVVLKSRIGGHRFLDKLAGEQLPRIC